MRRTPLILITSELEEMHLIRSIHNPHCPARRIHVRERSLLRHTSATVSLDRAIDDLEHNLRHEDLDGRNLLERALGIALINLDSGVQDGQTRGINLDTGARDALEHDAVLMQHLAEGLLCGVIHAGEEVLEGLLRSANGAHSVVNTSGAQTALDDFEAAALAEDHVGGRDAHVVEGDVAVAVGGIVVAEDGEHAVYGDAGGVVGDEDDGLLLVFVGVIGVGFAEDDVDFAAGVADAGGPPLLEWALIKVGSGRGGRKGRTWPFRT